MRAASMLHVAARPRGEGSRFMQQHEVMVGSGGLLLHGTLTIPDQPAGIVIFAHGSGSSRHSPRNRFVADIINDHGLATLLFDLLTEEEEREDEFTGHLRFDIELLAGRVGLAARWSRSDDRVAGLPVGYFGASTGAAAALVAAARHPDEVAAVVSRGGRPDLAGSALPDVQAPTLLIVGGEDQPVIPLNEQALRLLRCEKRLAIVPGAGHLFHEPGTLRRAALLAAEWFASRLAEAAPARKRHAGDDEPGRMATLVGINHVALEVDDIDEAIGFYSRIFRFRLRGRGRRMAFLDLGDQFIALAHGRRQGPDEHRHFGLVVDDVEAAREALHECGVELLDTSGLDFIDPWGNRIQVVAYSEVQFTKAPHVLDGMEVTPPPKSQQALDELRDKGMAPQDEA